MVPLLLGPASAVPDDSTLSDIPRGQVDYLSHNWREEDVWRSWRNMTRLKYEITNGVRLENASWRTWWKQRNGLKTVTPEELNWLKDSDVTWLYGPLHTADASPRPSAALDLPSAPSPSLDASGAVRKPILKHRSICDLLTSDFPLSPVFSPAESEEEVVPQVMSDEPASPHRPARPSLLHTKSDTNIVRRAFRRDSPPRVGELPASSLLQSDSPPYSVVPGQKRKHISFNTFVEQCIAIDKPKKKRPHYATPNSRFGNQYPLDDDGYDEDSEDGIIDEEDELLFDAYPQIHHPPHVSPPSSSTSEDDDDDVLQVRLRHSPTSSTSSSSPHSRPPKLRSAATRLRHPHSGTFVMRSPSTDKELVTIALIAPTILKTKLDDDVRSPSYPVSHSSLRPRDLHNPKTWSSGTHDSPVELVYVPPSYIYSTAEVNEDKPIKDTTTDQPRILDQPMSISPPSITQAPAGPQQCGVQDAPGPDADSMVRIEGATMEQNTAGPEVIVSSPDGQQESSRSRSCSRSRSGSRSRTPSPNTISPSAPSSSAAVVPRVNSSAQGTGGAFLTPSDPPLRGRSASSSSLPSLAQGGEQSRGRSITRTSSFSDRESISTDSPLGRLSPDANVGLGIGSVGVRDRERDSRIERDCKRTAERGRDRLPRRSGSHSASGSSSSLSPENPHGPARAVVQRPQLEQPPIPLVREKSASESSVITVVPAAIPRSPPCLVLEAKPITQTSYTEAPSIPISPSYAREEQESILRQPTPANSPVLASAPRPITRVDRRSSSRHSRSPVRNGEDGQQGTLVGRAVEIMSNAGAFLGSFWHSGAPTGVPGT